MTLLLLKHCPEKKYTRLQDEPGIKQRSYFKYDKSKKYSNWSDKTLQTYKNKEKIEDKIVIISTSVKPKSRSNFTHFEVKIKDFLIFAS